RVAARKANRSVGPLLAPDRLNRRAGLQRTAATYSRDWDHARTNPAGLNCPCTIARRRSSIRLCLGSGRRAGLGRNGRRPYRGFKFGLGTGADEPVIAGY
ncbi:hypothetical protein ACHAWF_013164, partial [Thalassiosira exigua]